MGKNAEPSARFIEEIAVLCKEIAALGYEIDTAKVLWGLFGSWSLIVIKGHEAIQFWWDRRDKYLTVERSPKQNLSAPNEWQDECAASPEDPKKWVIDYLNAKT